MLLACALAGAANVFAFAPFSWNVGGLPWSFITLGVLVASLCAEPRPRRAAVFGFIWGWANFATGVGWLGVALHSFGGMWLPFTLISVGLFCAYLALYPALAAWAFARLGGGHLPAWRAAPVFGGCWALTEWLRGTLLTGFPWLAIGYEQATEHALLRGVFPLLGVYGVGFILATMTALLWAHDWPGWFTRTLAQARVRLLQALLLFAALCALALFLRGVHWTRPEGEPLEVTIVQPNVDQTVKWDPAYFYTWFNRLIELTYQHPARLIVFPESALPVFESDLTDNLRQRLTQAAGRNTLLTGIFLHNEHGEAVNSLMTYGQDAGQSYGKHHLVPFGEYSPPLFGWFYTLVNIPMSDQARAPAHQPPVRIGNHLIAPDICYENLFGHEIARNARHAGILLNLSNLSWYGHSHAQAQHLQIGCARALETGRPYLSVTNSGATAILTPEGHTLAALPEHTEGALILPIQAHTGDTPYLRHADWPALLLALAALACGRRRRQ